MMKAPPPELEFYRNTDDPRISISSKMPLFTEAVSAGFPSPADDHMERELDLNELLIEHPAATFFVRVSGNSMENVGIHDGDTLIVDRALTPSDRSVVIAVLNGELTVKRVRTAGGTLRLVPENSDMEPIKVTPEMDFEVWGVVTNVIHRVR
jgi:DNA polymerase V